MDINSEYFVNWEFANRGKMAVVIDTVQALDHDITLNDFINFHKLVIPHFMDIDKILGYIADKPVLLTDQIIEIFNYRGDLPTQKRRVINFMKNNYIEFISLTNSEYTAFKYDQAEQTTEDDFVEPLNLDKIYPPLVNPDPNEIHILVQPHEFSELLATKPKGERRIFASFGKMIKDWFYIYAHSRQIYCERRIKILTEERQSRLG